MTNIQPAAVLDDVFKLRELTERVRPKLEG